jgi:hypothetical protein
MLQKFCFYKNRTFITCLLSCYPESPVTCGLCTLCALKKNHFARSCMFSYARMQSIPPSLHVPLCVTCVRPGTKHRAVLGSNALSRGDARSLRSRAFGLGNIRSRLRGFAAPLGNIRSRALCRVMFYLTKTVGKKVQITSQAVPMVIDAVMFVNLSIRYLAFMV